MTYGALEEAAHGLRSRLVLLGCPRILILVHLGRMVLVLLIAIPLKDVDVHHACLDVGPLLAILDVEFKVLTLMLLHMAILSNKDPTLSWPIPHTVNLVKLRKRVVAGTRPELLIIF